MGYPKHKHSLEDTSFPTDYLLCHKTGETDKIEFPNKSPLADK